MAELCQGRFRWDLIRDFPVQKPHEVVIGDHMAAEVADLLRESPGLSDLAVQGYFRLQAPRSLGGYGLSHYNTFRVLEAAATASLSGGLTLAFANCLGAAAFLPLASESPLRELIEEAVRSGAYAVYADAEPEEAGLPKRTTATLLPGAGEYRLSGSKVSVPHAALAELACVSATLTDGDQPRRGIVFVRAETLGVSVGAGPESGRTQGLSGARMEFRAAPVPTGRAIVVDTEHGDDTATGSTAAQVLDRGRLQCVAAPSFALAKLGVSWMREIATKRTIGGLPFAQDEAVQRKIADSLADTFVIESLAQWCLLPDDQDAGVDLSLDRQAVTHSSGRLSWDVVDRCASLLGGVRAEGYEQTLLDARELLALAGADHEAGAQLGEAILALHYAAPDVSHDPQPKRRGERAHDSAVENPWDAALSPRNYAHLFRLSEETRSLGQACRDLVAEYPEERAWLLEQRHTLILLSTWARELLAMSVALARASAMSVAGDDSAQPLVDVFCTAARHRIADARNRLVGNWDTDFPSVAEGWLSGKGFPSGRY